MGQPARRPTILEDIHDMPGQALRTATKPHHSERFIEGLHPFSRRLGFSRGDSHGIAILGRVICSPNALELAALLLK